MARRRRDRSSIATREFRPPRMNPLVFAVVVSRRSLVPVSRLSVRPLAEIEDRRTFSPMGPAHRRPLSVFGGPLHPLRVRSPDPARPNRLPAGIRFAHPARTVICVRRRVRREVLFAKRRTGRGQPRRRSPRRNYWSFVSC